MTLEEIKQLLAESNKAIVAELKTELTTQINQVSQSTAASLEEIKKSIPQPAAAEGSKADGELSLASLQNQVKTLTEQLADRDKQVFTVSRNEAIAALVGKSKSNNPTALQKLFTNQLGDNLKQENGSWFVTANGQVKPLDKAFDEYLATDEGKYFLPANPQLIGTDVQETTKTASTTEGKKTGADLLFDAVN